MGLINQSKLKILKNFEEWLYQKIEQEQTLALQISTKGFSMANCIVLHGCEFNLDAGDVMLWSDDFEIHIDFDADSVIEASNDELNQTIYCIKSKEMEVYIDVI